MKKIFFSILMIICIKPLFAVTNESIDFAKLEKFISNIKIRYKTPGISVKIINSEKTIFSYNLGVKDLNNKNPNDTNNFINSDTLFHIGSMTKAMTGFLIARYVEKGVLKWDSTIVEIFPEIENSIRKEYHNATLYELLTHRAHIQPFTENSLRILLFMGSPKNQKYKFMKYALKFPPVEIPKSKMFLYSNAGISIVSAMLERVTGKSWETLINEELFLPLKIKALTSWPPKSEAQGHKFNTKSKKNIRANTKLPSVLSPAGHVSISINEYSKFIKEYLKGIQGEDSLLKSETINFLLYNNKQGDFSANVGWFNIFDDDFTISLHGGSAGTYYTKIHIIKEKGLAIIVFSNTGRYCPVDSIMSTIVKFIRDNKQRI